MCLHKQETCKEFSKSREVALRRYLSNEHALKRKDRWNSFNQGVAEYLQMGHAEKVPVQTMGRLVSSVYYLPMHGVLKEASSMTKLRIVFDASAKSTSGNSLNDTLLSGLSLYPLLPTIVNRFRLHMIRMSGDISKKFREVCLHPEDFDLKSISAPRGLWEDHRLSHEEANVWHYHVPLSSFSGP